MSIGLKSMVWVVDEDEILLPKARSINYQATHQRRLSRAWPIKVWISTPHEDMGTIPGDWTSLGMEPPSGHTGKALMEWGETMPYVRTPTGQLWLSWYSGLVLKVYTHDVLDKPEPWRFRPVLWSEKRAVAELLGSTVFLWPRTEDGDMLCLTEPLLVTSVLWDANPSRRRPGLGLTPIEKSGATGIVDRSIAWPLRDLRNLPKDGKERTMSKSDAMSPAIVLWYDKGSDDRKPVEMALRNSQEYATDVPSWFPVNNELLPFHSLRLAVYDDLGAHPLVWDDAKLPAILKSQFRETLQEKGVAGLCTICAEEGEGAVPESVKDSRLCSRHRALRRTMHNKQVHARLTPRAERLFRFAVNHDMEDELDG